MINDQSYFNAINKRKSIRKYRDEVFNEELTRKVVNTINKNLKGEFEEKIGVFLKLNGKEIQNYLRGFIGSYGKIHAPHYLIVTNTKEEDLLVETGRVVEKIILELTMLGIGTCWIGGQFKGKELIQELNLDENTFVVAIIALGTPKDRDKPRDLSLSKKRKSLDDIYFQMPYPDNGTDELKSFEKLEKAVISVQLAPSAVNMQPWRMIFFRDGVHFYCQEKKILTKAFGYQLHYLDMGIAMAHFELVMTEEGIRGSFRRVKQQTPKGLEYISSYVFEQIVSYFSEQD